MLQENGYVPDPPRADDTSRASDADCLRRWVEGDDPEQARRAKIILMVLEGHRDTQIAAILGISRKTVWRWRTRYAERGLAGVEHARPRTGREPKRYQILAQRIIDTTLTVKPPQTEQWSVRRLAEFLGVSRAMVHRVWKKNGISPNPKTA